MYKVGIPLTYFLVSNDSCHLTWFGCLREVYVDEEWGAPGVTVKV